MNARVNVIDKLRMHPRVDIVDDERRSGNGVIVTLREGWSFDPLQDSRVAGADTPAKATALVYTAQPFAGPFAP